MKIHIFLAAAIMAATPALAEPAQRGAQPADIAAALAVLQEQRNAALDQVVELRVALASAQRDLAAAHKEIESLKSKPAPEDGKPGADQSPRPSSKAP